MNRLYNMILERIDRAIAGGTKAQVWWLTLSVVVLVSIFSAVTILFNLDIFDDSLAVTKVQSVIYHFIDAGGQSMVADSPVVVQVFTFVISFFGMIVLNGMLISALTNTIERRVNNIERGLVTYKNLTDHTIIIGYSEMTICLVNNILKANDYNPEHTSFWQRERLLRKVGKIVVFTNQDIESVRAQVYSQIHDGAESLIIFYSGSLESEEHLSRLNVNTARVAYILGDNNEYGRDSKSLACINHISNLRGDSVLEVNVQFDLLPSYNNIKKLVIPDDYITPRNSPAGTKPNIYFRPFNFYENWSRLVWSSYADGEKYRPLDFEPMAGERHVHLFIVGFHRMGRAMLLEALRICHYANYDETNPNTRTKITIVDSNLDEQIAAFKSQYPHLEEQIEDIEIEYISDYVESDEVREKIDLAARDDSALLTIAICLNDPDMSLSTGLSLPESCYFLPDKIDGDKKNIKENRMRTNILIRQELQYGIGDILDRDHDRFNNVQVFGMLAKGVSDKIFNDDLPMYINHNYNLLIEKQQLLPLYLNESLEIDLTSAKAEWIGLAENLRWANRYQTDGFATHKRALAAIGITEVDQLSSVDNATLEPIAKAEHRRWMAERTVSGWRQIRPERGEIRMDKFQLHDLFVPYDELSQFEKDKDCVVVLNALILCKLFNL